jgi:hypothetical protein
MPLIQVFTSAQAPTEPLRDQLLSDLSRSLAEHFGKPERWVMTCIVPGLAMTFGGISAPCCFAAVKNIGTLSPDAATKLSADLCTRLSRGLGIPEDRIYLEFTEAVGHLWGYDGATFG